MPVADKSDCLPAPTASATDLPPKRPVQMPLKTELGVGQCFVIGEKASSGVQAKGCGEEVSWCTRNSSPQLESDFAAFGTVACSYFLCIIA
jgi:hypothetical protein